ncbi:cryptochrome/photolyase family protein [Roseovarius salinarum]|uniref:cryptochrome/photolyase family protein n=1 Tax=Roseovarius salinarum TaxID=1981892 RepID=UPI000C3344E4|nr:deoxyribodipyrimidine photo-lyase [Roseovarius salinarum]
MTTPAPTLLWLRRDLRLDDHPALVAACADGGPVIPVFIHDETVENLGAAPRWRLGLAVADLARQLEDAGSRLILRRGDALAALRDLVAETGAGTVRWTRAYDPEAIARDTGVKTALKGQGIAAHSHPGHVLFEPWTVETKTGGMYRVYTPFWNAVKDRAVPEPQAPPARLPAPGTWPASEQLETWAMDAAMDRGAAVCRPWQRVGAAAARDRLAWFTGGPIADYPTQRDLPAADGTSGLSQNLSLGEISVRRCWHAALRALHDGHAGAEDWLKELAWRDFAYHLIYHTPRLARDNWRGEWDAFPWSRDGDSAQARAWKQGRTGVPFVDAAMREMYVTGTMHNRARMVVASYLTKHLLTHWKIGLDWFADCLTDWDPASNALGWQWAAGSGPDATPYFRVFNPDTQLRKFDPDGAYVRRWIAEGQARPARTALGYFEAVPRRWGLSPQAAYPETPVVGLAEGRRRALDAYENRTF